MAWTMMQQAAIDVRQSNILVSAAAGSGKTAVLTERVFQRVIGNEKEKGIDIDRFLIVTFTSAAANEMKERIGDKIEKEVERLQEIEQLSEQEKEKMAYLERQLALLPKASISTIHSFCLKVIKNYFNQLDIDPNMKVGSMPELNMLQLEILEEMMEAHFEKEENEDFLQLVDTYASIRSMDPFIQLILQIYTFSKSTLNPDGWLMEKASQLIMDYQVVDEMPWSQFLMKDIRSQLEDLAIIYQEAIALCYKPDGPQLYGEVLQNDKEQLEGVIEEESLQDSIRRLGEISFKRLPGKKQECDPVLKERVKNYRATGKKIIEDLQEQTKFMMDPILLEKLKKSGEIMRTLVDLIIEFDEKYSEAKKEKGIFDYNDLEHLCLKVLTSKEVNEKGEAVLESSTSAKELGEFYKEIYIDEYQDSNKVQETILSAIAQADFQGSTRFMVGDMKQSIYRFRLANPHIFAQKYETWEKYQDNQEGSKEDNKNQLEINKNLCIDLSKNFRSRENILEATNDIFEQIMSKQVGELAYDEAAKLRVGNTYEEGYHEELKDAIADHVELHIMETKQADEPLQRPENESEDKEGATEELEELKNLELEAMMVATMIDRLLKQEANPKVIYDKEQGIYRPVEARDIVILLRSTADKANIFEEALLSKGIGAYAETSDDFFEAMEIKTAISMLQIVDNPRQDIPILTVLRSPIVGLSFDELIKIRLSNPQVDFYQAIVEYSKDHEEQIVIKTFIEQLERYRVKAPSITVSELLGRIFVETGYYRYVGTLPQGAKQKANLRMLKKYAQDFENASDIGLFNFIQYLDKLKRTGTKLEQAKVSNENENIVKIMTIHKSKGLEFPIVFLSNASKKFNNQDIMGKVLLDDELGLGPKYIDTNESMIYDTLPFMAIKNKIISENTSEEMRILYVALTRAKEKLFITGVVKDLEKEVMKWSHYGIRSQKEILPLGIKKSPTYLKWIGMSLFALENFEEVRQIIHEEASYIFKGNSHWKIVRWNLAGLKVERQLSEEIVSEKKEELENWDTSKTYGAYKEEIYRRLNFTYPYQQATKLPTKVSVSELKRNQNLKQTDRTKIPQISQEIDNESRKIEYLYQKPATLPRFIKEFHEEAEGARRGILLHSLFEHLDLVKYKTYEAIEQELIRLTMTNKVTSQAVELVDLNRLVSLSQSDIILRMGKSKKVWKEKAFVYLQNAARIDENYPAQEEILVQGVIDSFFEEEDGLVIIDYKTDYVDLKNQEQSIERIKDRYSIQLERYAEAVSSIMKEPIKTKMLYLYSINRWITV